MSEPCTSREPCACAWCLTWRCRDCGEIMSYRLDQQAMVCFNHGPLDADAAIQILKAVFPDGLEL